jgi:hypothetical protein
MPRLLWRAVVPICCGAIVFVAFESSARAQDIQVTSTVPQLCGGAYSSAPYPLYTQGTFTYTIPAGYDIVGATVSGTWGNTCYSRSTAGVDVRLSGVTVAQCLAGSAGCWIDQAAGLPPRPWSVTIPTSLFPQLATGAAQMTAQQTSSTWVELGQATLTLTLRPRTVSVWVGTNVPGVSVTVDGRMFTASTQFSWVVDSVHTISTATPQGGGGTRYVFANWSDGGALTHSVTTPAGTTTYTANFTTQYLLTTAASPAGAGTVGANPSAADGYYNAGVSVQVTAAPNAGYAFGSWSGDLAGTANPQTLQLEAPRSVTATFTTTAVRAQGDFTGDLKSDTLWRHVTQGDVWLWPMDGAARLSENYVRTVADTAWEIRGLGDHTGDGKADILWRNWTTGRIYLWPMNGSSPLDETYVGTVSTDYDIVGTGDFNGDGKSDILWRNLTSGEVWIWLMNGAMRLSEAYVDRVDLAYVVKGVGDLDGDGKADIVWHRNSAGDVWVWLMSGTTRLNQIWVATVPDIRYQIQAVADFDGDSKADILWWHGTSGEVWIWTMNGAMRQAVTCVATVPDTDYRIVGAGDYDGNGRADILWHHATRGEVWVWLMNGAARLSETWVATVPDAGYLVVKGR